MKNTHNLHSYDSVRDFLIACDRPAHKSWIKANRTLSSRKENAGNDWDDGVGYEGAKTLAVNGWDKGLKEITNKLKIIPHQGETRNTVNCVAGSHPNVPRFIAGIPDCMQRKVMTHSNRKPCMDIIVNASYSGGINASHIMNYGAAIASLIDTLEHTGYSIRLSVAGCGTTRSNKTEGFIVKVKDYGDHLDLGRLAYFVAHPALMRRLGFAHIENFNPSSDIGGGYGSPANLPKGYTSDLYFPCRNELRECNTEAGAVEFVNNEIKAQMPELMAA